MPWAYSYNLAPPPGHFGALPVHAIGMMQRDLFPKKMMAAGRMALWLALALLTWHCAQQARPQGGPRDKQPPKVLESDPMPGTLNFDEEKVTVTFSEPIRKPTYDKEIFISPFISPPEIRLADSYRKFTIEFREPLRPATTYIITLNEVKDNTESNPLEEPYLLAFSTGDQLDSLRLPGKIFVPELGQPAKELTVLLYDADSAFSNQFYQATGLRKRPAYLTQTNGQGEFEFRYLRPGPYRVVGMAAETQNAGQVAITLDTVIVVSDPQDSASLEPVKLLAFEPDEQKAPQVLRSKLWSESVVDFSLSETPRLDSLQAWSTDTLGQDSLPLQALTLYRDERGPRLLARVQGELPRQVYFRQLQDSLGYRADTSLRVLPQPAARRPKPWLTEPQLDLERRAWRVLMPHQPNQAQRSAITLSDTARSDSNRQYFDVQITQEGFFLLIRPDTLTNPTAPYLIRMPGQTGGLQDSLLRDSVFIAQVKWYDPATYGSLSGTVQLDSGYRGPIVLEVLNEQKKVVATSQDPVFRFPQLKEGTYSFRVLLDADGNGAYTPGRLWPPRWPERSYPVQETVSLRGNWTFEDHVVKVVTTDAAAVNAAPPAPEGAAADSTSAPPGQGPRRP